MARSTRIGRFETSVYGGEAVRAYIPPPLPPSPPIAIDSRLQHLLDEANLALGRLDGIGDVLPETALFIYFYIRKEAVLSSQIEGTQSSLSDFLRYERDPTVHVPVEDVIDVSNYVRAMTHGLERLRQDFPLSLRLLREIHGLLLSTGRGSQRTPGEFRRSQNWVGGSRPGDAVYVPPPQNLVPDLMGELERFLHTPAAEVPTLLKAALAHVQFETIHPFQDGNGRLGRLLITFLLCAQGVLREPLLYLSLYLKRNRQQYYDLLQRVRFQGAWEDWLKFFLTGVHEVSTQAFTTAKSILALFDADQREIQGLGRTAGTVLRVHQHLQKSPITTVSELASSLQITPPTARSALAKLERLGLVAAHRQGPRLLNYAYLPYLRLLDEGTEPLP